MPDSTHANQPEDLMRETVSDDELRIILDRIGQMEFAGEPATTVQDIVEGTGADPVMVGRILADIRKESFEAKYGLKVEDHEARIESFEYQKAKLQDAVGELKERAAELTQKTQVVERVVYVTKSTEHPERRKHIFEDIVEAPIKRPQPRVEHPDLAKLRSAAKWRKQDERSAQVIWFIIMVLTIVAVLFYILK